MLRLIGIFLVLSVAAMLGLGMHGDTGLVLLAWGRTTVEMPIWLAGVIILISFALFYLGVRLFKLMLGWPRWWAGFSHMRRKRKALSMTNQGFIELAEGNWLQAERDLIRSAFESELPVLNYLGAAEAAQAQGAHQRRDKYLKLASHTKGSELAVGLKAAEFELNHGQVDQALDRLDDLKRLAPRHPVVLNLLKRAYSLKQDWKSLLALLPSLKKYAFVDEVAHSELERQIYVSILNATRAGSDPKALIAVWENMPTVYQQDPYFVLVYVEALALHKQYELSEKVLRRAIAHYWQEQWVRLYGLIEHLYPARSLSAAEEWIKAHAESAVLFLTLGRLAMKAEQWGKAERYLEVSLSLMPEPDVYAEMGRLYERLERLEQSQDCYRKGLLMASRHEALGRVIAPVIRSSVNAESTG
ncbi:MAG: heme biosynthesis HemY N-terminal domain-containing protein [Gammaproteobacteria bacterium]